MDQYGEYIGVDNVYYAEVTQDDASAYVAGTPEFLAPAASVVMEPQINTKNRYYNNKAYFTTTSEGETKVSIVISGLSLALGAKLLGKHYDETAKRLIDTGDGSKAPDLALGFQADVEGGTRFFWFLKGKFSPFKEEAETVTNNINEKTISLTFTALVTVHDKFNVDGKPKPVKRYVADTRDDDTVTAATWFAEVQKPADVSAA